MARVGDSCLLARFRAILHTVMSAVPNVLAERYASASMRELWSPVGRIRLERELWLAVLRAQRDLGLAIPAEAIAAYERALPDIDLAAIAERERRTRHDVKARLEDFNERAGWEKIHQGMTSRDLTENVEQLQVWRSLTILRDRAVAALARIAARASEHRDTVLTARTHNVPAQPTTLGKRFAMFGEELLRATAALQTFLDAYPLRGLQGAVGTQIDQLSLFDGNRERAAALQDRVRAHLGLGGAWNAVGQVYPRSLDFESVSVLVQLTSGPSSFARTLRLMAGHELADEGFAEGQTGSSAMPHKVNARSCERVTGMHLILKGHLTMAAGLAGDQWNEGDVACSVVRRVVLPDACFAADGLFETFLTVLDQMNVHRAVIARENARHLPFLATTTVLMAAVKAGAGREEAHAAIKGHALAVARGLRDGSLAANDLARRLGEDPLLRLSIPQVEAIITDAAALTGLAAQQVDAFAAAAQPWTERFPTAASYRPGPIL